MDEIKEPSFGRLVVYRAWFAAWQFFESKLRDAILFAGTLFVGGVAYYLLYGLPATEEQIVPVLIFTVGPIVGLWLLLFIWHLWLAPSALIYEAARKAALTSGPPANLPAPTKAPPPDVNWAIWKQRNSYNLNEFAGLLAKDDPSHDPSTPQARSFLRLAQDDAMNGKLTVVRDRNAHHSYLPDLHPYYFDVPRPEAIKWAAAKGFDISHIT
jgi:hypothetical protein